MYFAFKFTWSSIILQLHIVLEEQGVCVFFTYWTKFVRRDKSYLLMIPYYLSLIFSLTRLELLCWFSMLLSISRSKERTTTLWKPQKIAFSLKSCWRSIGYFRKNQKKKEERESWGYTFLNTPLPPPSCKFYTCDLKILEKKSFHPWKFSKILWHPLKIPRSKTKTHVVVIPLDFFLKHPRKFHFF